MNKFLTLDSDDLNATALALSNSVRISIISLLAEGPQNIKDIADKLNIPMSSTTINIQKLEDVGIITSELRPGKRGSQKICSLSAKKIIFDFEKELETDTDHSVHIPMPIGQFVACDVHPTCGIASELKPIGLYDETKTFYLPEKVDAQLIWFSHGYLEYNFPNKTPYGATLDSIEVIGEVCSEAPGTNEDWPSDITVWINGREIGTWTSPGDFGNKKGFLTPVWWETDKTQYGILKHWSVTKDGSFIDAIPVADTTLKDLAINQTPFIKLRIGVKDDAPNKGGMNLFGHKFGNYNQDLVMKLTYHYESKK